MWGETAFEHSYIASPKMTVFHDPSLVVFAPYGPLDINCGLLNPNLAITEVAAKTLAVDSRITHLSLHVLSQLSVPLREAFNKLAYGSQQTTTDHWECLKTK